MLLDLGRRELSLARILEAHTDALAILDEGSHSPLPDALYGVWASEGPQSVVQAQPVSDGGWQLSGLKQYCSGSTFCSVALVTARHGEDVLLFEVPLHARGVRIQTSTWASPAFADTQTRPVIFDNVVVPESAKIGGANWYLSRPGFWHGAIGPAACWAGGAISLIDAAAALNRKDPHSRAHVGALQAIAWGIDAVLLQSGNEIDADPLDSTGDARVRALKVRHLIERWCTEVIDRFGRATGPQLLAYDANIASQQIALTVYIRQCHGERDLVTIPT